MRLLERHRFADGQFAAKGIDTFEPDPALVSVPVVNGVPRPSSALVAVGKRFLLTWK